MVPLGYYIVLSAILFSIGVWGVLKSRNAIIIFMGIELMLNAVNLAIIAFSSNMRQILSRLLQNIPAEKAADYIGTATASGQVLVFLVMTVAAAEAAVGLAIIISIYRMKDSVNVDDVNIMKW
ncbi:MAG TPA: NADH-quinone oxidoreductase subunit NuoK [candidate division Zixibacteria bacterium]|jgi:NADH-quinone oxidoreductase subunit K|nr:NADH-quinone oxidoreductase subunit NuoK [candidate division Zixibacteria bacterium]